MSTLADRLRGLVGAGCHPTPGRTVPAGPGGDASAAADVLGGEWCAIDGHRYLVVERRFAAGYRHGRVAVADTLPPDDGAWRTLSLVEPSVAPGRLLFFDLETTGLAGGAGTYAFLVGCGWYEPPSAGAPAGHGACFRTRQFFLANYGAEKALLEQVAADAGGSAAIVTYNGKAFDLPVMETRYVLHRLPTPFGALPHLDMLHPARRLWRADEEAADAGCRLTDLEQAVCGHRRDGDVPGYEIPARYFHYVRTGDPRPLEAVLEHNRLDLLALALVTARAAQMLEDGPAAARTAREAVGLGRLYERSGRVHEATACYARAEELPGAVAARAEALRAFAVLARRGRRYEESAAAWRRLLTLRRCPPAIAREATEALAVHHEHRARDLREARRFAVQALQFNISLSRQQAVHHRLARLDRKLGLPGAPLF
jgi:uncharacterized protein YprB with RNaseH-like and TPR domain